MPQERIPLPVTDGPTANGKTRPAAELTLRHDGEMVSVDSMQTYRGVEIGTAKPTPEETLGVPHYLMGFMEPDQSLSIADHVALAEEAIVDIHSRGHLPVPAGGTELYTHSLITNIALTEADNDPALYAELTRRAAQEGTEGLTQELCSLDPESADRIKSRNLPWLIRTIELYHVTNVVMTEYLRRLRLVPSPYRACFLCLGLRDRERLYEKISQRVDEVFRRGLVEEAKEFLEVPSGAMAIQAIDCKELLPCFRGEVSLSEAQDVIKYEARHYVKRQLTWFHREKRAHWLFVDDCAQWDALRGTAEEIIRGELYE